MAAHDNTMKGKRWRDCIARGWQNCLDLALVLWIVRVPLCAVIVGFLILDYTAQAQDLFTEFADDYGRLILFLALLTLVWAATTHYAARLLLDTDKRFGAYVNAHASHFLTSVERWIPRVLGMMPFAIALIASERSIWNLPEIADAGKISAVVRTLRVFDALVVAVAAAFLWYMVKRQDLMATRLVRRAEAKAGIVNRLLQPLGLGGNGRQNAHDARRIQPALGPLLLIIVFLLAAAVIFAGADHAAAWLPRALIVPVILGGWLPLLTFLSGLGRRMRAPLIVGAALLVAVFSAFLGDNHSVRRINAATLLNRPVDMSTVRLNQALDLWMRENGCAGNPGSCPRPIIIVGAGGASRAGFFTASVIGELLDQAKFHTSEGNTLDAGKIRKRIFAISAVSGSAVGAAMTVAALARSGPETIQPCGKHNPGLWYGEDINNWRDCLEALMAGDFLTATMIGLTFHDTIRFGWWRDRAALLERSWELRFANVMGTRRGNWQDGCPGDMRCPFMTVRPNAQRWVPLLLLNGTSAATGRRLLTTVLDSDYSVTHGCPTQAPQKIVRELKAKSPVKQNYEDRGCPIFMDATPFHELLAKQTDIGFSTKLQRWFLWEYVREKLPFLNISRQRLDDVRLSTAAHNSARFPVISPPGAVRNFEHNIVDRIVDGGYIENYGALTAMELAVAIDAVEPALAPFVLVISNDPEENPDLNRIDVPDTVFLTDVSIPVEAIENTRNGRGRLAVLQLNAALDRLTNSSCRRKNTAHVRVWPQYAPAGEGEKKETRPVSLSWWLSTPIQIHLHQQTEAGKSGNKNSSEIEEIWRALEDTSACVAR
ncbi:MAG TPA: hypothetical protein VH558_01230 [Pseudolabrys sp.]